MDTDSRSSLNRILHQHHTLILQGKQRTRFQFVCMNHHFTFENWHMHIQSCTQWTLINGSYSIVTLMCITKCFQITIHCQQCFFTSVLVHMLIMIDNKCYERSSTSVYLPLPFLLLRRVHPHTQETLNRLDCLHRNTNYILCLVFTQN